MLINADERSTLAVSKPVVEVANVRVPIGPY